MINKSLLYRLNRYYLQTKYYISKDRCYPGLHLHHRFKNKVSLTFDDGPNSTSTLEVSRLLKVNGVRGTFFVEGQKVLKHPDVIVTLDKDGHLIGNHSFDHPRWKDVTADMIRSQIDQTEKAIDMVLKERYANGYPHSFFRPPYGLPWTRGGTRKTKSILQQILDEKNLVLTLWQIDSKDWRYTKVKDVIKHLNECVSRVQGGVILFHDSNDHAAPILEEVLELLRNKELTIVGLDELIGDV